MALPTVTWLSRMWDVVGKFPRKTPKQEDPQNILEKLDAEKRTQYYTNSAEIPPQHTRAPEKIPLSKTSPSVQWKNTGSQEFAQRRVQTWRIIGRILEIGQRAKIQNNPNISCCPKFGGKHLRVKVEPVEHLHIILTLLQRVEILYFCSNKCFLSFINFYSLVPNEFWQGCGLCT